MPSPPGPPADPRRAIPPRTSCLLGLSSAAPADTGSQNLQEIKEHGNPPGCRPLIVQLTQKPKFLSHENTGTSACNHLSPGSWPDEAEMRFSMLGLGSARQTPAAEGLGFGRSRINAPFTPGIPSSPVAPALAALVASCPACRRQDMLK